MAESILDRFSLSFIAFLQATGVSLYCVLIGFIFWNGERLFGPPFLFLGPAIFLVLFIVSALITALTVLGYPFILFWEKKKTRKAIKLVTYTAIWLSVYISFFILLLVSVN